MAGISRETQTTTIATATTTTRTTTAMMMTSAPRSQSPSSLDGIFDCDSSLDAPSDTGPPFYRMADSSMPSSPTSSPFICRPVADGSVAMSSNEIGIYRHPDKARAGMAGNEMKPKSFRQIGAQQQEQQQQQQQKQLELRLQQQLSTAMAFQTIGDVGSNGQNQHGMRNNSSTMVGHTMSTNPILGPDMAELHGAFVPVNKQQRHRQDTSIFSNPAEIQAGPIGSVATTMPLYANSKVCSASTVPTTAGSIVPQITPRTTRNTFITDSFGGKQFTCQARGVLEEHNASNATIYVAPFATHGMPLQCSNRACRASGRRFRWCAVCQIPVARGNFVRRHAHKGTPVDQLSKGQGVTQNQSNSGTIGL